MDIYSSITHNSKKVKATKSLLKDERRKKIGSFNGMSPKKEILTHATMWMNLGICYYIMLSEVSQSQMDKHCIALFIYCIEGRKIHRQKKEGWLPRDGGASMGVIVKQKMNKFWRWIVVTVTQLYIMLLVCILKNGYNGKFYVILPQ